jgi:hypothetical protein
MRKNVKRGTEQRSGQKINKIVIYETLILRDLYIEMRINKK